MTPRDLSNGQFFSLAVAMTVYPDSLRSCTASTPISTEGEISKAMHAEERNRALTKTDGTRSAPNEDGDVVLGRVRGVIELVA